MVMLCKAAIGRVYELQDERGRALGRIVEPRGTLGFGPRAGTVLLRREQPRLRPVFLHLPANRTRGR